MDKAENTKQKCRIYLEIIFYCKWRTNYVKKQLVPKFVWAVCSCRETLYLMLEESSKNKLKRDERCWVCLKTWESCVQLSQTEWLVCYSLMTETIANPLYVLWCKWTVLWVVAIDHCTRCIPSWYIFLWICFLFVSLVLLLAWDGTLSSSRLHR